MKILMLTSEFPPHRGGVGTYAAELARATAELGHEVTLLAPDYGMDQRQADARLPYRMIRFPGGPNRAIDILDKARIVRTLARSGADFDVVHALDWPFFLPLALSAYRGRARCLLTFHGTEINKMRRPSRAAVLRLCSFWDGWAEVITNSRFTARHLLSTFPEARQCSVRAVPLGVRSREASSLPDRQDARETLGLADDTFVLVSLGRIVERKGQHVTAGALKLLPDSVLRRLHWYVIGPSKDDVYFERIRRVARELTCATTFTGDLPPEAVEQHLAAADLFCLPAVWGRRGEFEGFGLVYLEAALFAVPSVATTLGGIPDAVLDGETGILVPPSDTRALADAILALHSDPQLRMSLGARAQVHARSATWEAVAQKTYAP